MTRRSWPYAIAAMVILAAAASIEWRMGRVLICRCGYVKLWHGVVNSSENSQHLSDWYTFTHVIHGIGFYALLWLTARRLPPQIIRHTRNVRHAAVGRSAEETIHRRAWCGTRSRQSVKAHQPRSAVHLDADRDHGRLDLLHDVGEADRPLHILRVGDATAQRRKLE